jgi:hypothetical protein
VDKYQDLSTEHVQLSLLSLNTDSLVIWQSNGVELSTISSILDLWATQTSSGLSGISTQIECAPFGCLVMTPYSTTFQSNR